MFKELFISALLSFSVGTSNVSSGKYLNGYYCLRDTFDLESFDDFSLTVGSTSGGLDNDSIYYVNLKYYDYTHNTYSTYPFYLTIEKEDSDLIFNFADLGGTSYTVNSYIDSSLSTMRGDLKFFVVYFDSITYVNDNNYLLFNSLFSRQNSFCTTYGGYFHLNNTFTTGGDMFSIYGSVVIENVLKTGINLTDIRSLYNDNGVFIGSNQNIYFSNVLLPSILYNELTDYGVFGFVADSTNTGFNDLFYCIADTPVVFLYDLLAFDLFGQQVFTAFCSLITILLFVIIIRKII